ncbi:restriction endonuclease subunit S [Lactobacillus mulieris]|uniref:restriction endonuclease subunit S n=1 Tax=Lactobacillus mulieris TaxID=2508708 RepID=UPI0022AC0F9F|nr:restriction endonuclease subunit S [Lactobacillus mulieris]MCZ3635657.1 restriction endonuclease subunit S [Lactobacillus mulieris]MCZ3703644.1 restriction endonuclease subunit S [Lactobacillus mulieris]MCZ3705289.1 restriction endonuclease subunit S [Lactobacillus mulieris]MCZ3706918.1 restriction endonuclease subunit S [Lactobacillus mulieris]MCZ3721207.1 restriction endonuclease subunit S [Lactobacillus mulieris]
MYPKVRFRGFDEPWKTKNVSSTFDIITDYVANGSFESLRKNVVTYKSYNYAYMIRLQDASNNWQGPWLYTDKKGYNFLSKSKLFPGDIVMSNVGSVGLFYLIPDLGKPMTLAPNSILLRSSFENNRFLFSLMNSNLIKTQIEKEKSPGAQPKINKTDFKKIKLVIPQRTEQNVIANLFKVIDSLLSLQQRKLELESLLYKHLKRNCFYNNYNFYYSKPKKLNIKMKDIITLEDNQRIPVSENNRKKGITPYYGANGIQDYVDGYTHVGQYILIAEDGASDIQNYPVIAVNGKVWINNHAHVLKVNKTVDFSYLLYFLKNFNYFPWLVGSGRFKLNAKTLLNIKISIDSNTENQRKIGVLLNECDSLTHATSTRIKLIKDIKQFLLQNLFI